MEGLERKLMRNTTLQCLSLTLTLSGSTPVVCVHRYFDYVDMKICFEDI